MGEYRTGLHRGACHGADARHEDVGRHLPVHLPHTQRGQPRPRQFHQRHPLRPGQWLQPGATLPRGLHCGRDLRLPQGRLHQHTRLPPRLRTLARRGAVGRLRQSAHWSGQARQPAYALRHHGQRHAVRFRVRGDGGHAAPGGHQHRPADGRNRHRHPD